MLYRLKGALWNTLHRLGLRPRPPGGLCGCCGYTDNSEEWWTRPPWFQVKDVEDGNPKRWFTGIQSCPRCGYRMDLVHVGANSYEYSVGRPR